MTDTTAKTETTETVETTQQAEKPAAPRRNRGKSRRSTVGGFGAMPGAELMTSFWKAFEDMPKIPLDVTRSLAPQSNGKLAEEATKMAERFMEFGQTRYKADMDFLTELSHCKTAEEVLSLQKDWFETAVHDYQSNNAAIFEAGVRMFADSVALSEEVSDRFVSKP